MKLAVYHPWIYLRGGIERTLLELAQWLKARQNKSRDQLERGQLYVERPDGQGLVVDVGGDPLVLSEHQLRVAVRIAMQTAMSNE